MSDYLLSTYVLKRFSGYKEKIERILQDKENEFKLEEEYSRTRFTLTKRKLLKFMEAIEADQEYSETFKRVFFTELEEDIAKLRSIDSFYEILSASYMEKLFAFSRDEAFDIDQKPKIEEKVKREEEVIAEKKDKKQAIKDIEYFLGIDIPYSEFKSGVYAEIVKLEAIPDSDNEAIKNKVKYIQQVINENLRGAAEHIIKEYSQRFTDAKLSTDRWDVAHESFEFLRKSAEAGDVKSFKENLAILREEAKLFLKEDIGTVASDGILSQSFVNLFPQFDLSGGLWDIANNKLVRLENKQFNVANGKMYWTGPDFNNPIEVLLLSGSRLTSLIKTNDGVETIVPTFELLTPEEYQNFKNKVVV